MGRTASIRSTIFPERGIRVSASFWLTLAVAALVAPPSLLAAGLLAAALHEGGHLAALAAFHTPVEGLRLGAFGAEIYARTERLSYGREALVTLAGPAANLLAAPLLARLAAHWAWEWGWLPAGANALLGVYNLLPAAPMDGARLVYLLAARRFGPDAGERARAAVGLPCALALCGLCAYCSLACGAALPLLAALGLLRGAARELGLAKCARSV